MKAIREIFIGFFIVTIVFFGCAPKSSDIVVLEIGNTKVSLAEYENFYMRNSGGWETGKKSTIEERERFLDLLTNYKLKLQDAKDHNLVNDTDVVKEISDYRASLASTFMLDKELTESGTKRLYDHKKEEIRAQHILLKVAPNTSPEETLKIYNKAVDLIRRIKVGENFDSLAIHNSEDPSVKINAGDVYWFVGGQFVPAFENAAYSMKNGEISSTPVRSSFGYHIIKINGRQQARGSIKVYHIMTRFQKSAADSVDTLAALHRIQGLRDSLKKGWDFHKLAVKLSEDGGSAPKGGELGWIERRRFVQPFDEAAFNLKIGETSGIVRTPFGYHLIYSDSIKPLPPFSDPKLKEDLKKTYQQSLYSSDLAEYIEKLKKEFNYSFNEKTFDDFVSSLDSTKTTSDSAWADAVPQSVRKQPLMTLNGKQIFTDSVIFLLGSRQDYQNTPLRSNELHNRLDRMANAFLIDVRSIGLENRTPEFGILMNEYQDGIILYKAEQMEVWNKISVSDSSLKEYYNSNLNKFIFPDRVNIVVLSFDTDTLAALVYDSLKRGTDFSSLVSRYKELPPPKSKDGSRGLQPVDTDQLTKHAATLSVGDISDLIKLEDGSYAIIKVVAKEPSRQKTFEEAGAEVSNTYQEYASKMLEHQWLDRIKQKHPVIQNKTVLSEAFTSSPPEK